MPVYESLNDQDIYEYIQAFGGLEEVFSETFHKYAKEDAGDCDEDLSCGIGKLHVDSDSSALPLSSAEAALLAKTALREGSYDAFALSISQIPDSPHKSTADDDDDDEDDDDDGGDTLWADFALPTNFDLLFGTATPTPPSVKVTPLPNPPTLGESLSTVGDPDIDLLAPLPIAHQALRSSFFGEMDQPEPVSGNSPAVKALDLLYSDDSDTDGSFGGLGGMLEESFRNKTYQEFLSNAAVDVEVPDRPTNVPLSKDELFDKGLHSCIFDLFGDADNHGSISLGNFLTDTPQRLDGISPDQRRFHPLMHYPSSSHEKSLHSGCLNGCDRSSLSSGPFEYDFPVSKGLKLVTAGSTLRPESAYPRDNVLATGLSHEDVERAEAFVRGVKERTICHTNFAALDDFDIAKFFSATDTSLEKTLEPHQRLVLPLLPLVLERTPSPCDDNVPTLYSKDRNLSKVLLLEVALSGQRLDDNDDWIQTIHSVFELDKDFTEELRLCGPALDTPMMQESLDWTVMRTPSPESLSPPGTVTARLGSSKGEQHSTAAPKRLSHFYEGNTQIEIVCDEIVAPKPRVNNRLMSQPTHPPKRNRSIRRIFFPKSAQSMTELPSLQSKSTKKSDVASKDPHSREAPSERSSIRLITLWRSKSFSRRSSLTHSTLNMESGVSLAGPAAEYVRENDHRIPVAGSLLSIGTVSAQKMLKPDDYESPESNTLPTALTEDTLTSLLNEGIDEEHTNRRPVTEYISTPAPRNYNDGESRDGDIEGDCCGEDHAKSQWPGNVFGTRRSDSTDQTKNSTYTSIRFARRPTYFSDARKRSKKAQRSVPPTVREGVTEAKPILKKRHSLRRSGTIIRSLFTGHQAVTPDATL